MSDILRTHSREVAKDAVDSLVGRGYKRVGPGIGLWPGQFTSYRSVVDGDTLYFVEYRVRYGEGEEEVFTGKM